MKSTYCLKIIPVIIIVIITVSFIVQNDAFGMVPNPIPFLFTPFNQIEYGKGDLIHVVDMDWSDLDGKQAIMKVFNPDGKLYLSQPFTFGFGPGRGSNFTITDPLAIPGYYEISLYYNNQLRVGTTILYDGKDTNPDRYYTYMVSSGNTDIPIGYKVGANTILEYITFNHTSNAIYVHTYKQDYSRPTSLTIELPRDVIDSKAYDGTDQPYTVSAPGPPTGAFVPYNNFTEVASNNDTRTLVIDFPPADYILPIAIQGTQSVPEFGATSMIVLVMAITGIITVSVISRQKFGL